MRLDSKLVYGRAVGSCTQFNLMHRRRAPPDPSDWRRRRRCVGCKRLSCILLELRAGTAKMPACCAPGYNRSTCTSRGLLFSAEPFGCAREEAACGPPSRDEAGRGREKDVARGSRFFSGLLFFSGGNTSFYFRPSDLPRVSRHPREEEWSCRAFASSMCESFCWHAAFEKKRRTNERSV